MATPTLRKFAQRSSHVDLVGNTWIYIGMCAGNLEAVRHVEAVLAPKGIEPSIEGSVMYSISVLEPDFQSAVDLLKNDKDASDYHITIYVD
jgi:hypothetical protein